MIIIKSKKAGFRRCGIVHGTERQEYADNAFSPEQLAILQAEPMLIVKMSAAPASAGADETSPDKAAPSKEQYIAADTGKDPVKPGKKGKK